jgi:hypothetical protein
MREMMMKMMVEMMWEMMPETMLVGILQAWILGVTSRDPQTSRNATKPHN